MNKYHGKIGFITTEETSPGVWAEVITEREYYGDLVKRGYKLDNSSEIIDNFSITNQFSILIDPFLSKNFSYIRYLEFMGVLWKVNNVDVQYPRLVLSVGGVYNGK